jgi:SM-20-related protein
MTLKQIAQVLPASLLKEVSEHISTVPWRYGWASNKSIEFTHWNHDFTGAPVYNSLDCAAELPEPIKTAWHYIQSQFLGAQCLLRCYVNSHTYGVEGYPHTDSKRDADNTLVVYMNPEWRRDWGGETMVYDGYNIVHAELPKYNKGLVFPGAKTHQARSVTRICPAQRITLMFKFCAADTDTQRDRIQQFVTAVGAHKIKHSGGTLAAHLLNTYDILKANDYDQVSCNAGALHSIFGTNAFKTEILKLEDRAQVVNVIGEEAASLVELFHYIRRPHALERALATNTRLVDANTGNPITLTQAQLNRLCAIEAANLSDQKALKNYEHLRKLITK